MKTKLGDLISMICQWVRKKQVNEILVCRLRNSFFLSHKLRSITYPMLKKTKQSRLHVSPTEWVFKKLEDEEDVLLIYGY
jgi:hypothetical protein